MVDYVTAVLSGVGVLVVLGLGYLVWSKWLSPPDQREATEETREELRLEDEQVSNAERVGLFERTRAQPGTTKAFYTSIILLLVVIAVGGYSVLQSGSPSEMKYATQLQQLLFGTVIAVGVTWFVRRQDRKAGRLRVILENDSTSAKEIPFDWHLAEPSTAANEGKDVVLAPAFKKSRLLGLFWRVDLVGDDPMVRNLDKAQPHDRSLYEIPMDDSSTWDHRERTVTVRAKDIEPYRNPERAATHRFVPSDRASKGELDDKRETIAELEAEIDHLERMDAIKDAELGTLEEKLKNFEHGSEENFEDAMETIMGLISALNGQQPARREESNGSNGAAGVLDQTKQTTNGHTE